MHFVLSWISEQHLSYQNKTAPRKLTNNDKKQSVLLKAWKNVCNNRPFVSWLWSIRKLEFTTLGLTLLHRTYWQGVCCKTQPHSSEKYITLTLVSQVFYLQWNVCVCCLCLIFVEQHQEITSDWTVDLNLSWHDVKLQHFTSSRLARCHLNRKSCVFSFFLKSIYSNRYARRWKL